MKYLFLMLYITGALAACNKSIVPVEKKTLTDSIIITDSLTYLALGDSYTIGESVEQGQSFPYQLTARLNETGHFVKKPDIIALTGWTTGDLITAIDNRKLKDAKFDMVTLLIGVNNQYRGYSTADYRPEFVKLLNTAINHAKAGKQLVFVLSIPDWGVTPYAEGRDRAQISKEIDEYNAINKQESEKAGVTYIDITLTSRLAQTDTGLLAPDGLHPSGRMYAMWVNQLLPKVVEAIK